MRKGKLDELKQKRSEGFIACIFFETRHAARHSNSHLHLTRR